MAETPFPEQMLVEGGRSVFSLPNDSVVPYMAATVTLTTTKYAQEHPDVIQKVLAVEMRTARWIMENPLRARDIITARLKYKPEVVKAIDPKCYKWGRNGLFLTSSIHWWGQQMKELGIIQTEPDYAKYFVTTYADAAAKTIGRASDLDFDVSAKASDKINATTDNREPSMIKPYLAVCMQPPIHLARSRQDVAENIKRVVDMIDLSVFLRRRWPSAWVGGDVRVVVFPEYCFTDWRQIAAGVKRPTEPKSARKRIFEAWFAGSGGKSALIRFAFQE